MKTLAAIVFVGLLAQGCGTDADAEDFGAPFDEDLIDEAGVVIEAAVPEDAGDPTDDGKDGGEPTNGEGGNGGVVNGGEGGEGGEGGNGEGGNGEGGNGEGGNGEGGNGEGGGDKEDCPPTATPL